MSNKPTVDELDVLIQHQQDMVHDVGSVAAHAPESDGSYGEIIAAEYQLLEALQYLKEQING